MEMSIFALMRLFEEVHYDKVGNALYPLKDLAFGDNWENNITLTHDFYHHKFLFLVPDRPSIMRIDSFPIKSELMLVVSTELDDYNHGMYYRTCQEQLKSTIVPCINSDCTLDVNSIDTP